MSKRGKKKPTTAAWGPKVLRVPVKYDYAAIHPEFLKMMAEIGSYANEKYGSWAQYLNARLTGNADPINHIYEHARSFQMRELYDHFEGDPRRHLAAIAYNAMMSFAAETKWGPDPSKYSIDEMLPWPPTSEWWLPRQKDGSDFPIGGFEKEIKRKARWPEDSMIWTRVKPEPLHWDPSLGSLPKRKKRKAKRGER